MEPYVVLDKKVGETPLSCAEEWRAKHPQYADVSLAYAGRLDPMASGKLLVLISEECKKQTEYHDLDKTYEFSVLFGIESDSLDVLGRLNVCKPSSDIQLENWVGLGLAPRSAQFESSYITTVIEKFVGRIELPYPKFSAKTVKGKPLHMWTLEGRLNEIEIPTKESEIYSFEFLNIEKLSRDELVRQALEKVNSIPEVTDPRKALGNDFRRTDVREDWNNILNDNSLPSEFIIADFICTASSGTYMRTLAYEVAKKLGTCGLAWRIHRTHIGHYDKESNSWKIEY